MPNLEFLVTAGVIDILCVQTDVPSAFLVSGHDEKQDLFK